MTESTLCFIGVQHDVVDPGPLRVPFCDATMGPFERWEMDWLRLTADDGVEGLGPCALHPAIGDVLLTAGPLTLPQWWHKLWWMLRNAGHRNPSTSHFLYGFDMAVRDILAKRAGLSWHRHAGAQRDTVPVYGSGGGTNLPLDDLVAEMAAMAAQGFATLKMKVGKDFGERMDEDVQRVRAVREALGDGIGLAVDANQAWTAHEARTFARRIADLDIAWFEEPVHSADRVALCDLCADCPIPVAMGESECHWLGFRDMLECGVHHLQPAPHQMPGCDRWRDAVAYARQAGPIWSSGGSPYQHAMYIATQPDGVVEYLRPIHAQLSTVFAVSPKISDGLIHLPPERPGLPVSIDWTERERAGTVHTVTIQRA